MCRCHVFRTETRKALHESKNCQVANFGTLFSQSGTSREPVANQSEKRKIEEQQNLAFLSIFRLFEAVHGFSRLVPDRFLTGSRFATTGAILLLRRFWRQFLNDFWRQKTNRFGLKTGLNLGFERTKASDNLVKRCRHRFAVWCLDGGCNYVPNQHWTGFGFMTCFAPKTRILTPNLDLRNFCPC